MNAIRGEILDFIESDELSLVSLSTALGEFSVLMLNFSHSLNAQKGAKVELLFKENELGLAKFEAFDDGVFNKTSVSGAADSPKNSACGVACENAFKGVVASIDKGELLWQVFVKASQSNFSKSSSKGGEKGVRKNSKDLNLSALLTAKAGELLNLKPNDEVVGFVKPSDIIIKVL